MPSRPGARLSGATAAGAPQTVTPDGRAGEAGAEKSGAIGEPGMTPREQRRLDDVLAAAIRAISGDPQVAWHEGELRRRGARVPLPAPHLHPAAGDDLASFRGSADGVALRLQHCDLRLHEQLCPADPMARLLFDLLEQYRVESLADPSMVGVATNLDHRHRQWSLAFHHSGLTDTASGLLVYTVAQVCRARITGRPVVHETEDVIESTRFSLAPVIGSDLAGLRRHRDDQRAYGVHALAIAHTVATMLHETQASPGGGARARGADEAAQWHALLWQGLGGDDLPSARDSGPDTAPDGSRPGGTATYTVFTTAYDREERAVTTVRPELARQYRAELDKRLAALGINAGRLARRLADQLGEPGLAGWEADQEAGHIDGHRLAQLISDPDLRRLFRVEHVRSTAHASVTFLLDCSGSMRAHGLAIALLVDVFSRALEQAGVSNEILGFTTGAWSGGRAQRDWLRTGRPPRPGRLNELRHLVFKDAAASWRQARPGIAALLHPDLYREGIDGEAVAWALRRSGAIDARRRIVAIVSDGSPMDSATVLANDPGLLDAHLREVVAREEERCAAEIVGIGVGLDLSRYYEHSCMLDLSGDGGLRTMFGVVADLLCRRREGEPRR